VFLCSFPLFFLFPSLLHTFHQPERLKHCFYRAKMRDVTKKQACHIPFATHISQHIYKHQ
jgi:hypothetical protein